MVQMFNKLEEELTPSLQINLFPQEDLWVEECKEWAHPITLLRQWEEEWEIRFLSGQHRTVFHKIKALIPFIRQASEDNLLETKAVSEIEDLYGRKEASRTTVRIISSCHSRST